MKTVLVTSTDDGIGKTAIGLALARAAQGRGQTVGYMKPKGTRLRSAVGKTRDEDPMFARELLGLDAEVHEMEPIVYSPTFVQMAVQGLEDPDELEARVEENFRSLSEDADLMIVEGSDDLATGSIVDLTDVDLADILDASVLLVSGFEEVRDTDDVLAAAETIGEHFDGVLFNRVSNAEMDELTDDVLPFLENRGVPVHGAIPRVKELAGVTIDELSKSLGCDVLTTDAPLDAHVERFTVGAMGGNSALAQFRRTRDAVMITGGDRSEIQTAALEASGIEALLLTGGFRPPSAVLGRAEKEGTPILLVQSDTKTTIDRVEAVLRSGRTRSTATVERMGELLEDGVDVESILEFDI